MSDIRNPDFADLDLDFIAHPATGDVVRKIGVEAIKRSVRNLVLTNFHDRPYQPNLGSSVQKLLFEPIMPTTRIMIERAITEVITNFEPRVALKAVNAYVAPDENGYDVEIIFYINNVPDPIITSIFLERLR